MLMFTVQHLRYSFARASLTYYFHNFSIVLRRLSVFMTSVGFTIFQNCKYFAFIYSRLHCNDNGSYNSP